MPVKKKSKTKKPIPKKVGKRPAKTKVATPTRKPKDTGPISKLIDEVGDLQKAVKKIDVDPKITKLADKTEQLRDRMEKGMKSDKEKTSRGIRYVAELGMKGQAREIVEGGMEKIFKQLGKTDFFKLCTFPLTELDNYFTPEEVTEIINSERKNKRKLKVSATE